MPLSAKIMNRIKTPLKQPSSRSLAFDEEHVENANYAQFLSNSKGEVEHVVLHIDDWERLAKLDPVYQAMNKQEGLQLNIMLPEGKVVRLPHAVAVMMVKYGENLLKSWRLYRGYNQSDFEDQGIRQPTMSQIEKSTRSRLSTLEKLAEIYGCDVDQLASFILDKKDKSLDV